MNEKNFPVFAWRTIFFFFFFQYLLIALKFRTIWKGRSRERQELIEKATQLSSIVFRTEVSLLLFFFFSTLIEQKCHILTVLECSVRPPVSLEISHYFSLSLLAQINLVSIIRHNNTLSHLTRSRLWHFRFLCSPSCEYITHIRLNNARKGICDVIYIYNIFFTHIIHKFICYIR